MHEAKTLKKIFAHFIILFALTACSQSNITDLSENSFLVETSAGSVCGIEKVKTSILALAAVAVIKKGGDQFAVISRRIVPQVRYSGTLILRTIEAKLIVTMSAENSSAETHSARAVLGADWQQTVSSGLPQTCN